MIVLRAIGTALLMVRVVPASAQVDQWASEISNASSRFGLPAQWIRRVMNAESGGRRLFDGRPVVSRAGAMGLMQLMPGTWSEMRSMLGLGPDPFEPKDNILAGAAYLRIMYNRFGYPGLFAAYNAGPARYSDYLSQGRDLPPETVTYVAKTSNRKLRGDIARRLQHSPAYGGSGVMVRTPQRNPRDDLFAIKGVSPLGGGPSN